MALDSEYKAMFEALDTLDNIVTAPCRHLESWGQILDRLVMVAVHNEGFGLDNFEEAA